jgi:hypothetical protein
MNPNRDKDDLKQLREDRKPQIDRARNLIKAQAALIKAIRLQLESGAKTVPQIAAAAGLETAQVLLYVSGLRKYGVMAEGPKDDDYYTYELVSKKDAYGEMS